MLYLVIFALAVLAAVVAAPMLRFDNPMRELDRWWTARDLTTDWSRQLAHGGGADEA
ncbi:MAG: hypothetical protein M3P04_09095 [Actinomycetota bacterium]|nr:hypothetical protein [Actinomycetota bacterium]